MGKILSEEEVAAYVSDGFHFPIPVMNKCQARSFRTKLEDFEAKNDKNIRQKIKTKMHLVLTWINDLVTLPTVLDSVEDVIGPDILCWNSTFFIKEAHYPGHVTWHQNSAYWGMDSPDNVTAWIALSCVSIEAGPMRVIPGSHKRPQLDHEDTFAEDNLLSRRQRLAKDPDDTDGIDLVLEAGEMSLHHVALVHGSSSNRTNDRRIGLAVRYLPPHVRQVGGIEDTALLVRGEDCYNNFHHERPPKAYMDPEALEYHSKIIHNMAKVKFADTGRGYS